MFDNSDNTMHPATTRIIASSRADGGWNGCLAMCYTRDVCRPAAQSDDTRWIGVGRIGHFVTVWALVTLVTRDVNCLSSNSLCEVVIRPVLGTALAMFLYTEHRTWLSTRVLIQEGAEPWSP